MTTLFDTETIRRSAVFSPCRQYRYELWRQWSDKLPTVMFIGLNPSTADETKDDATIRRCIQFARQWGFGSICMTNLFAWRSTDPGAMKKVDEPTGPDNDRTLQDIAYRAGLIVGAWGNHGAHRGRDKEVLELIRWPIWCLRTTKPGQPEHPLYVPYSQPLTLYREGQGCDGYNGDGM